MAHGLRFDDRNYSPKTVTQGSCRSPLSVERLPSYKGLTPDVVPIALLSMLGHLQITLLIF